jgi:squalene-hopene/tetraprenyl-beta-curcumene cyclase
MDQISLQELAESRGALRRPAPGTDDRLTFVDESVRAARRQLLSLQQADGHWCAELEGDTILESEYVLLLHFLGRTDEERVRKAANYLRVKQLPEGGWGGYPGGGADVSNSVKAYFVLKLVGDDPDAPHMARAREVIRRKGGLHACNSFTKLYLSIFGQYEWDRSPGVPPELVLLPLWFPINIYDMSSWSRAIVVPLSIIWAHKPTCQVPEWAAISELLVESTRRAVPQFSRASLLHHGWSTFFQVLDRLHKTMERWHLMPLRARALKRAEAWTLERLEMSDGLGAIFPPIVNTIIALRCQGYAEDHPVIRAQVAELEKLEIEKGETLRLQPCKSPVWDTALSLNALAESDEAGDRARLEQAVEWLLGKEVKEPGDWQIRNPAAPVGGWYFEYANEFYPDCDDTAQVLSAVAKLRPLSGDLEKRFAQTSERALSWLVAMQNSDGGWASFDKDCDKEFLTYVPFADHNAMIDPSTTDITARALEALAASGYDLSSRVVRRAVDFIRSKQKPDGTWYGRWGCNYIYGTWLALAGLRAAGEDLSQPWAQRAADWLRSCQNADGGWGELPDSYADASKKGIGPSTAAQTAWAILALVSTGDRDSESLGRGVDYLLSSQKSDGGWKDEWWTGTGFPEVFYLDYHLYATYFSLLALQVYRQAVAADGHAGTARVGLHGV